MKVERDKSIDILRGIAIFTMIAANMAAHTLQEPHSLLFRMYGSIAAPLFIFLAGMMVSFTSKAKAYSIQYYLKRCVSIWLIAALIDVFLWDIVPFTTFDVLYIIALAMPLIYYFNKLHLIIKISTILILFIATPILQSLFGYNEYPFEANIFINNSINELNLKLVLQQFFIDGWFPIFPWLGVSFLGALIGTYKNNIPANVFNNRLLVIGFVLLLIGGISWFYLKPVLYTREGYSELFYPPTLSYLISITGFIFVLNFIVYQVKESTIINLLSVFGKSSLLVYILHTLIIVFVFSFFDSYTPLIFTVLYLLHATVLWFVCYFIKIAIRNKKLPFLAGLILGS